MLRHRISRITFCLGDFGFLLCRLGFKFMLNGMKPESSQNAEPSARSIHVKQVEHVIAAVVPCD